MAFNATLSVFSFGWSCKQEKVSVRFPHYTLSLCFERSPKEYFSAVVFL